MNHLRRHKARDFIGKGRLGREQQGKGTRENCSATWLSVSVFMVKVLVSGLSLASHLACLIFGLTWGLSWCHANLSAKMDSSTRNLGAWQDGIGAGVSSLLWAPPKFFQLAIAYPFLMGTSCEILSVVITLTGQGGWFPMVP